MADFQKITGYYRLKTGHSQLVNKCENGESVTSHHLGEDVITIFLNEDRKISNYDCMNIIRLTYQKDKQLLMALHRAIEYQFALHDDMEELDYD